MQDREVVGALLEGMGHDVLMHDIPSIYCQQDLPIPVPRDWSRRAIAIMFEHVFTFTERPLACLLYVNPEWLSRQDLKRLEAGAVDLLLAKTRDASQRLTAAVSGLEVVYTGFASSPLPRFGFSPNYDKAMHVRGYANQKGTDKVLGAYARSGGRLPDCICTMRSSDSGLPAFLSRIGSNCSVLFRDIEQRALEKMMARRGFHLCPSEREGFGHYIFGPMSIGCVVLTVDAAPMNELVDASCGLLVPARIEDRGLYANATVSVPDLLEGIGRFASMDLQARIRMGMAAKQKASEMRQDFEARFGFVIGLLLGSLAGRS